MATQPCIDSNPDISGVGVRVSIYVQALVNLAAITMFSADGVISKNEQHIINAGSNNIFITGCAILAAAIVQQRTYGLSVYHTLIILNLGWINGLSGIFSVMINPFDSAIENLKTNDGSKREGVQGAVQRSQSSQKSPSESETPINLLMISAAQLTFLGAVGVWFWAKVESFDKNQSECTPETFLTLFGRDLFVTNQTLRKVSIAVYAIAAAPFINIIALLIAILPPAVILMLILKACFSRFQNKGYNEYRRFTFLAWVISIAFLEIAFVVNTEVMIARSRRMVKEGEADWTFGQVLAMFMIIFPVFEVLKGVYRSFKEGKVNDVPLQLNSRYVLPYLPPLQLADMFPSPPRGANV